MPAGESGPGTGTLPRSTAVADTGSRSLFRLRPGRRLPWRTALAIAGGLLLVLAFPGHDLPALAVLGPALLSIAVRGERARSGLWLGLVFGLLSLVVIVLGAVFAVGLASNGLGTLAILAAVLAGVAVLGISLIQSALSGIYSAALYRYAVSGTAPNGFDGAVKALL